MVLIASYLGAVLAIVILILTIIGIFRDIKIDNYDYTNDHLLTRNF